jgi:hypothetical protein
MRPVLVVGGQTPYFGDSPVGVLQLAPNWCRFPTFFGRDRIRKRQVLTARGQTPYFGGLAVRDLEIVPGRWR